MTQPRLSGPSFGSDKANEDVAPVQAKVVEYLGPSHLEKNRLMNRRAEALWHRRPEFWPESRMTVFSDRTLIQIIGRDVSESCALMRAT